jgi:HK97 family phage prohead protease
MEIKQKIHDSRDLWKTASVTLENKGQVHIAVNAIGNEDSDGDITAPGAFKKTLKENFDRVRWFLNHDISLLLGVPIKGWEDSQYLNMVAQFNLEKQIARDTYEDYKLYNEYGKTLEHSVGLQAIKYSIDNNTGIRTVAEWKLWEFTTLTGWGSNSNTPLIGIKTLLKDKPPNEIAEILSKMNTGNYSDTRKKEAENIYESLFIEPSRRTLDPEADLRTILKNLNIPKI